MSRELVLSRRMQSVADRVSTGLVLADVGCDHGYLSIWLCQTDRIPSAIAMDVNKGPLERAARNAALYGLEDRISLRLSDGLMELKSGEAGSVAIAGMGGMLIIRILKAREDILKEVKELVLEPQSDVEGVRRFLLQSGFRIEDEDLVLEDGKFYPVIRAVHSETASGPEADKAASDTGADTGGLCTAGTAAGQAGVSELQTEEQPIFLKYGRCLLEKRHPVLKEYLQRMLTQTEELILRLEKAATEKGLARAAELKEERQDLERALEYYRN